jgi:hypothetical protein
MESVLVAGVAVARYTVSMEHPIDRMMRRFRGLFLSLAVFALPVMIISYGWLMVKAYHILGGPVFVVVFLSHVIGWIGIASLIDSLTERKNPQPSDQS